MWNARMETYKYPLADAEYRVAINILIKKFDQVL